MEQCACGKFMTVVAGEKDSRLLIIGPEPEHEDLAANMPFVSKKGEILQAELNRVGLDLRKCRLTYVWRHAPSESCKGHMGDALREMKDRPFVLLIGASTCAAFGIDDSQSLIGLPITNFLFPETCGFVTCVMQPPQNGAIGEFRLAIEKLAKRMKEVR